MKAGLIDVHQSARFMIIDGNIIMFRTKKFRGLSMVILELYQGDFQKDLVAFDSLEEGKALFSNSGYTETEDGFEGSI